MDLTEIKIKGIKDSYECIIKEIQNNNPLAVYSAFYNYLYNFFSLKESKGEKYTIKVKTQNNKYTNLKKDCVFGALKYLYEIFKHMEENKSNLLLKLNLFVYVKKFPYSYPYNYGRAFVRFEELQDEIINLMKNKEHKVRFKELYAKYLQGKLLEEIVNEINDEVLKEINNG